MNENTIQPAPADFACPYYCTMERSLEYLIGEEIPTKARQIVAIYRTNGLQRKGNANANAK